MVMTAVLGDPEDNRRKRVARTIVRTYDFYYRLLAFKWRSFEYDLNLGLLVNSKIIAYWIDSIRKDLKCKPRSWDDTGCFQDQDFLNWIRNDSSITRINQWIQQEKDRENEIREARRSQYDYDSDDSSGWDLFD